MSREAKKKQPTRPLKRAAIEHGVPRSTLQDRVLENVIHGVNPGRDPYLRLKRKNYESDYIVTVGQIGFGKTRKEIKAIAVKLQKIRVH